MTGGQLMIGVSRVNRLFKNLRGGVLIASFVILVTFFLTYIIFNKTVTESELINHSAGVQNSLEKMVSSLKDGESAIRGYLLTDDSSFLAPFYGAESQTMFYLNSLKVLTENNVQEQACLDSLKIYIGRRFENLNHLYAYKMNGQLTEEDKWQTMQNGRKNMAQAMVLVNKIRSIEEDIYSSKYLSTRTNMQNARTLITIFLSISVIVAITTLYILSKSQNEIANREMRYRSLFELSHEIIFTLRDKYQVTDINKSVADHLGYTDEEVKQTGLLTIFSEADRTNVMRIMDAGEQVINREVTLHTKQGGKKVFLLNLILADKTKKHYQGSLYDIHERIKLEEEKLSLERFVNVGKVARVIAHEVRNPLTNINLSVEALKKTNDELAINDYIRIIENNATRINNLVTELLSATKLTEFNFEPVQINALIDETLNAMADRIQLKNIRVEKMYDPEICAVKGDADKLQMAFLNLIVNGIEAMDEGGTLKIQTLKQGQRCIVIIEDNGKGISKEHIGNIFQPFYSTKTNGTGLGLATTQNIIINHKGSIYLESEPGKGTKFFVSLEISQTG